LLGSCWVSTQVVPPQQVKLQQELPHLTAPGGQHKPLTHSPDRHTVPHTPQLLGSVLVLTHLPPQQVKPVEHGGLHPLAKTLPSPLSASRLPTVEATNVLSAWRREVGVARALVRSSKREGSISFRPFYRQRCLYMWENNAQGQNDVEQPESSIQ